MIIIKCRAFDSITEIVLTKVPSFAPKRQEHACRFFSLISIFNFSLRINKCIELTVLEHFCIYLYINYSFVDNLYLFNYN